MTHICVSKLATTGSDNGLAPGILLVRTLRTNFHEIVSKIHTLRLNFFQVSLHWHRRYKQSTHYIFWDARLAFIRSSFYYMTPMHNNANFFIPPSGSFNFFHYDDVIMTMLASQITSLTVVYSIVYSGVNQRKHQSSASLAFVREIHRGPVNFPHKWPVTRKMFPFDDVIMQVPFPWSSLCLQMP